MNFVRGPDGKIASPVRLSGNVGDYELAFKPERMSAFPALASSLAND